MKKFTTAAAATALAAGILLAAGGGAMATDIGATPVPVSAATVEAVKKAAYEAVVYQKMLNAAHLAIEKRDSKNPSELDVAQGTAPDISTATVEVSEQGGMGPAGIWFIAGAGVLAAAGAAGLATSGIKGKKARS